MTFYSTQIEGNRLTQAQVEEVITGAKFPGRQHDETEVRNYYRAIVEVERLAIETGHVSEAEIQIFQDSSRKNRSYRLAPGYEQLAIGARE